MGPHRAHESLIEHEESQVDRLRMLEVFKAVADRGSFTKAADALGLSNAVTSRALQELETELGVRLLQRTTRSVSLTSEGRDVLERAQSLLESYDDLLAASKVGAEETAGEIRLSAPSSLGGRRLGPCSPASPNATPWCASTCNSPIRRTTWWARAWTWRCAWVTT